MNSDVKKQLVKIFDSLTNANINQLYKKAPVKSGMTVLTDHSSKAMRSKIIKQLQNPKNLTYVIKNIQNGVFHKVWANELSDVPVDILMTPAELLNYTKEHIEFTAPTYLLRIIEEFGEKGLQDFAERTDIDDYLVEMTKVLNENFEKMLSESTDASDEHERKNIIEQDNAQPVSDTTNSQLVRRQENKIKKLENQFNAADTHIKELRTEVRDEKQKNKDLEIQNKELFRQIEKLNKKIEDKDGKISLLTNRHTDESEYASKLTENINSLKAQIKQLNDENEKFAVERIALQKKIEANGANGHSIANNNNENLIEGNTIEIYALKKKNDDLMAEVTVTRENNEPIKNELSKQQKENGTIDSEVNEQTELLQNDQLVNEIGNVDVNAEKSILIIGIPSSSQILQNMESKVDFLAHTKMLKEPYSSMNHVYAYSKISDVENILEKKLINYDEIIVLSNIVSHGDIRRIEKQELDNLVVIKDYELQQTLGEIMND